MIFPAELDPQEMEIFKKEWEITSVRQRYREKHDTEWINNSTTASTYTIYTGAVNNPWSYDTTNSATAYNPFDHMAWSVIRYPVEIAFYKGYRNVAVYRRPGRGWPWKKV